MSSFIVPRLDRRGTLRRIKKKLKLFVCCGRERHLANHEEECRVGEHLRSHQYLSAELQPRLNLRHQAVGTPRLRFAYYPVNLYMSIWAVS